MKFGDSYFLILIKRVFLVTYLILFRRPLRRRLNRHNKTNIVHDFDFSKVEVGNYTYGSLDIDEVFSNSSVKIGHYCSIAQNVKFICGNHNYRHFSTYPFGSILGKDDKKKIKTDLKYGLSDLEHFTKPIIVDDDVWIGAGAIILSGVHIGQGAVIGAGAVVTKDIPPYAIAGGIPTKVIKYRFPNDIIKKLLQIDYSRIQIEKFGEIYGETVKENFDVDYIFDKVK